MTAQELIAKVLELDATRFDKPVHLESLAEAAPILARMLQKAIELCPQIERQLDEVTT